MAETFTKQFKIKVSNLKVSLEEFIEKFEKLYDEFGNYTLSYEIENNTDDEAVTIIVTLVSQYYLFPLGNLVKLFDETITIEKDFRELEI